LVVPPTYRSWLRVALPVTESVDPTDKPCDSDVDPNTDNESFRVVAWVTTRLPLIVEFPPTAIPFWKVAASATFNVLPRVVCPDI